MGLRLKADEGTKIDILLNIKCIRSKKGVKLRFLSLTG